MSSLTLFLLFIPLLAVLLLTINLLFATHNPYQEKNTSFECGFHSFLGQNRTQFNISFFIFALLFLLFDLEILLIYPYSVSSYNNGVYGLLVMLLFFLLLTLGFVFELGKKALDIPSRQYRSNIKSRYLAKPKVEGKIYSAQALYLYPPKGFFTRVISSTLVFFYTPLYFYFNPILRILRLRAVRGANSLKKKGGVLPKLLDYFNGLLTMLGLPKGILTPKRIYYAFFFYRILKLIIKALGG